MPTLMQAATAPGVEQEQPAHLPRFTQSQPKSVWSVVGTWQTKRLEQIIKPNPGSRPDPKRAYYSAVLQRFGRLQAVQAIRRSFCCCGTFLCILGPCKCFWDVQGDQGEGINFCDRPRLAIVCGLTIATGTGEPGAKEKKTIRNGHVRLTRSRE